MFSRISEMNFKFYRNCDSLASKCQRHTSWKWSKLLRKAWKPILIRWMNITLPQCSHIIGKASKTRLGRGLITTAWRGQSGECSFVIRRFFFSCAVLESNNNVFLLSPFVITHLLTFYFHQCGLLIALLCTNVALKAIDKNVFFFIILFGCARKWPAKKKHRQLHMWITTRELRNKLICFFFLSFQEQFSRPTSSYWRHVPRTSPTCSRRHRWQPAQCASSSRRRRPRTWPRCSSSCTREKCMCRRRLWRAFLKRPKACRLVDEMILKEASENFANRRFSNICKPKIFWTFGTLFERQCFISKLTNA